MVEKGIRGRIYHSINRYAKANNEYMKEYDRNCHRNWQELSHLKYQDIDNLDVWVMSQKLPVNGFKVRNK